MKKKKTSAVTFEKRFKPGKSEIKGEFNHEVAVIRHECSLAGFTQTTYEKMTGKDSKEITRVEAMRIIRKEGLVSVLKERYGEVWDRPTSKKHAV